MPTLSSARALLAQIFARDGLLGRVRGTRRHLRAQRAAAELRASENRFRSLFDAAPVAIFISREGVVLYVNQAAVALLGGTRKADLIGQRVTDFMAGPDREIIEKRIERRARGLDEPLIYELEVLRPGDECVPLRVEVARLELADGDATLAFAFDLRPERAAQEQRDALLAKERRAALFAARLQGITADLAASHSGEAVADMILSRSLSALGARAGALSVPVAASDGAALEIIAARGYPTQVVSDYARLPLVADSPLPAVHAFWESRALWLENLEQIERDFPVFGEIFPTFGDQAVCVLPLRFENQTLGVLNLSFESAQEFDAETRAFMLTLASQCAAALERARLLTEAQDAARLQRESLALLNTLLDTAPVGFAFFDLQGCYVLVNHALSRINRVPVSEHLGKSISDIMPSVGPRLEPLMRRVIETGQPSGEVEILGVPVGGDTAVLHALIAFYPVRGIVPGAPRRASRRGGASGPGNEILGVGSVVIDISARVDAERDRIQLLGELEIERARFEAILQQMPSAVVIGEAPTGRMELCNPQVLEIMGPDFVMASNLEGYNRYQGFHFDGRRFEAHEWPLTRAIERGEVVRGEEILLRGGDGPDRVIRLNAAPIRDRDGHITAGIAVFDDVTSRARAEAAQRFLAEAGSALIATLDERGSYEQLAQLCVPGVADWCLIAVPGENGLLSQVAIAHADDSRREVVAAFQLALQNDPQLPWEVAGALRGKRAVLYPQHAVETLRELSPSADFAAFIGQIEAKSAIITPLRARGRVLGLMVWITAGSNRHYDDEDLELADEIGRRAALAATNARLYQEAGLARDEAQNANRAKDEFLAVVSHELRTPLTPILGWLELLRSPGAGEEIRAQAYDVIERNARAQAQLINDILDVSRITTGKLRLELKPVSLREVVERATEALRPGATEKGIDLRLELEEVGVAMIDAARLQQVVWNLLQNAIKFTPKAGTIRVFLRRGQNEANQSEANQSETNPNEAGADGEVAILGVADSGAGIAPEFLPHVFDRFRQADSSSTRRAGGLGLGLAIVAHIVAGHGGQVRARSEGVGRGATFEVELPLGAPATATVAAAPAGLVKARPNLSLLPVLVVDDEPDTREMLRVLLESCGARVLLTASASEALEKWQSFAPEMLLSDIAMPDQDGHSLRRELARAGFDAPSIALSAYTATSDVRRALESGFDAHLAKPVDAERLLDLIAQLMR